MAPSAMPCSMNMPRHANVVPASRGGRPHMPLGLAVPNACQRTQSVRRPALVRAAPPDGVHLSTQQVAVELSANEETTQAALASHMSLEGDFQSEVIWPSSVAATASATAAAAATVEDAVLAANGNGMAQAQHPLLMEVQQLEHMIAALQMLDSSESKVAWLSQQPRVLAFLQNSRNKAVIHAMSSLSSQEQYLLLCLPAMGQDHVLAMSPAAKEQGEVSTELLPRLSQLAGCLLRVDQFYDSIGGVLGYQCRSLDLIIAGSSELKEARLQQAAQQRTPEEAAREQASQQSLATASGVKYHVPRALDLAGEGGREVGARTAAAGLEALPHMAEIYPVGGAGDRLGLTCDVTGECLPSAMLPYCGRTMLEGLMRDLVAREHLYYRLTGRQVTTPVAIMTSEAKGNHHRITTLLNKLGWFGRGSNTFRIFKQPLVPVISVADGRWLLNDVLKPMTKPGGHGAIWKLMWDEGVFSWLQSLGRRAALIRQISNPMAGMDTTLLALAGSGAARNNAAFGFMSCDRTIGAAEGCNVLQERKVVGPDGQVQYEYGYTNIEYTEFDRLGICDQPVDGNSRRSVFPANTNVLYVGLQPAVNVVQQAIASHNAEQLMPGLIFNLKKQVAYTDPLSGEQLKLHAGRMECTMQNIADFLTDRLDEPLSPKDVSRKELSTFLVYNMRRKVTSSAKKKRAPGSTRISQTPDGSFYDLQRNAWHLLQQCCVQHVPELGSVEQYLDKGPGFIFLFNPALGPLWDVISQKLVGGSLHQGSEMVLEVAEARLTNIHVKGSFLVYADNVVGHMETAFPTSQDVDAMPEQRLQYSNRCGRIHMTNVHVNNKGIDWSAPGNLYWKHQVARREAVQVLLRGNAEFEAHDVTLTGAHTFDVPDGCRMVVTQGPAGNLIVNVQPLRWGMPTWQWVYTMSESGQIHLQFVSNGSTAPFPTPGISRVAGSVRPQVAPTHSRASPVQRISIKAPGTSLPRQHTTSSAGQLGHSNGAVHEPGFDKWHLLEQLAASDTALDFMI